MTPSAVLAGAILASIQAAPQSFEVAPGPTLESVNRVAAQAGIDVVVTINLAGRRSPRIRGRMTVDEALDRLLRPVGARAVRLGERVYRIEAIPPAPPPRRAPPPPPASLEPAGLEPAELEEVIVTAAVRRGGLDGANGRSPLDPDALARAQGGPASDTISDLSATVDSTRQGPGRNKLFIRGVADSAFNGPLQATVGQYLGDLRLTYGSPDPDLMLIDIRRVEVFEGPQSSRFGSGSIGGVVRIEPEPAALGERYAGVSAGLSATSGGESGTDAAVVINQPLGPSAAGRVVAYTRHDGGFLDNPVRGVRHADQVDTTGVRATVRLAGDAWTVDGLVLAQRISADDAQTVDAAPASLEKTRRIAEPYDSDLTLAGIVASRRFGQARFTSATSVSRQVLDERFDATTPSEPAPTAVDRRQTVRAFSSEARWDSGVDGLWSWNGGGAVAFGETRAVRERKRLDDGPEPGQGVDLRRRFAEGALFGELVAAPGPTWRVAAGGRLAAVRAIHEIRAVGGEPVIAGVSRDRIEVFFTPTFAVRWTAPGGVQAFARLEQGVRPGSLSEARGVLERFRSDRVTLLELGFHTPEGSRTWTGEVSAGQLDWRNIQADVVTQGGDLVTTNVGDGVVHFVQAKAAWRPNDALVVSGGVFANGSHLSLSGPSVIGVAGGDIPNVARTGAQLSIDYDYGRVAGAPLRLGADLRYVGRSRPGLGPGLDVPQGDYVRTDLVARLGDDRGAWSLRVSNPFDASGIRYGVGSPYQLSEPQGAPLRPLTVRLGFELAF